VTIESASNPWISKQFAIVVSICIILVSSLIIVDIVSAGHEYSTTEPSFVHDFPETVAFYNISEGVTSNTFSFIVEIPVIHSHHHHIAPKEISFLFWFRDATDGSDLSQFINAVFDNLWNSTFDLRIHDYDQVDRNESGWWAPSVLHVVFNSIPYADSLRFGYDLELILINEFGDDFNGHELEVQLEMNVTYSRWWFGLQIAPSQQTVTHIFNLSDDGVVDIVSLEY